MAVSLVESMADEWRPKDYRDTYTERVNKLIKAKQKGRTVKVEDEPAEATGVVDLMEALQRSVEASKKKRGTKVS
jgi:DNA end-binding protein Ku